MSDLLRREREPEMPRFRESRTPFLRPERHHQPPNIAFTDRRGGALLTKRNRDAVHVRGSLARLRQPLAAIDLRADLAATDKLDGQRPL